MTNQELLKKCLNNSTYIYISIEKNSIQSTLKLGKKQREEIALFTVLSVTSIPVNSVFCHNIWVFELDNKTDKMFYRMREEGDLVQDDDKIGGI